MDAEVRRAALLSLGLHLLALAGLFAAITLRGGAAAHQVEPRAIAATLVVLNSPADSSSKAAEAIGKQSNPPEQISQLSESAEQESDQPGPDERQEGATPEGGASSAAASAPNALDAVAAELSGEGLNTDPLLEAKYVAALRAAAVGGWDYINAPAGVACAVSIQQTIDGSISGAEFTDCKYDDDVQEALSEHLKATALPVKGFETLFERHRVEKIVFCRPPGC